jgi:hypothetical protein
MDRRRRDYVDFHWDLNREVVYLEEGSGMVDGKIYPGDVVQVIDRDPQSAHYYDRGGVSCIDYIKSKGFDFIEGNVVKYLTRWRWKGSPARDLEKLAVYVRMLQAAFEEGRYAATLESFGPKAVPTEALAAETATGESTAASATTTPRRTSGTNERPERLRPNLPGDVGAGGDHLPETFET